MSLELLTTRPVFHRAQRFTAAIDSVELLGGVLSEGLGNIVDADLGRESARLIAAQVRESLAIESVSIANRRPESLVALLDSAVTVSRPSQEEDGGASL